MSEKIEVEFIAKGTREIQVAFDTLESRMRAIEKSMGVAASGSTRAWSGAATNLERLGQKVAADQEKAAARAGKAQEKAAAEAVKAQEKAAAGIEKAYAKLAKDAERYAQQETRAVERAEAEKMRIRIRSSEMAGRLAERQAAEEMRAREKFNRMIGGGTRAGLSGLARAGIGLATMGLTIGGGFAIADAVRGQVSAEREAVALQNSAQLAGVNLSQSDILKRAKTVEAATNINKADVLKGFTEYVKISSDVTGGNQNLGEFAKLSKATGTDFTELMKFAGRLKAGNATLTNDQQMALLRNVIGQGGKGAIEIEDLAKVGGEIVSTAGLYGGDQARSQQRLLGLAQIPGKLFDASESATAVQRFGQDLEANADKIGATGTHYNRKTGQTETGLGVKVKDANGMLRDPADIIADLFAASNGDFGKLKQAGIGKESMKIFAGSLSEFQKYGGGKAGAEAVRQQISGLENAGATGSQVDEMFGRVMNENGEKFNAAVEKIQEALQTSLTPVVERLADKLPEFAAKMEKIIDAGGHLAEWFMDNPFKGVGAIVAAKLGEEIVAAGLGKALGTAIEKMGTGNIYIAAIAAEIALATIAIETMKGNSEGDAAASTEATAGRAANSDLIKKAMSGAQLSDEELTQLRERRKAIGNEEGLFVYEKAQHPLSSVSNFLAAGQVGFNELWRAFGGEAPERDRAQAQLPKLQKEAADIDAILGRASKQHGDAVTNAASKIVEAGNTFAKTVTAAAPGGAGGNPRSSPLAQR